MMIINDLITRLTYILAMLFILKNKVFKQNSLNAEKSSLRQIVLPSIELGKDNI